MARITLQFPDEVFRFSTEIVVRLSDVNAGNHLGNDKLVTMISEARDHFFVHHDFVEDNNSPINTLVTDQVIVYRAESRAREVLRFDVGLMDFNPYGGDFVYRISRVADGQRIADAKTGFVFFDARAGRVAPMPASFRERFPDVSTV